MSDAKLNGKLDYNAATLAAIAKWMQNGAKKPKRDYRKHKIHKKTTTKG